MRGPGTSPTRIRTRGRLRLALGLASAATTTSRAMGRGASLVRRHNWRPQARPSSLAHNAAIYVSNDQWYVIGGLWGPGTKKRGLERRGPFATVDELLASEEGSVLVQGDHEGCVDRRPRWAGRGACEFDGKVSVVDGRLYALVPIWCGETRRTACSAGGTCRC